MHMLLESEQGENIYLGTKDLLLQLVSLTANTVSETADFIRQFLGRVDPVLLYITHSP